MRQSQTNNEAFEVTIEKLVYGGDGLARKNGLVVLAPFVLPGERVLVETLEQKPDLLRTRLSEVREPAPGRVAPPCLYFGRCGGCQYQHADYEIQLELKRSILRETLARIGKISAPEEIRVISADPWNYRNRSQFHIDGTQIGYLEAQSNRLCAIDHCPISSPKINEVIGMFRRMLNDSRWPRFVRSLEIFTNERDVQLNVLETERPLARRFFEWCAAEIPGLVLGDLEYSAAGFIYRVSGGSFFQVNRFLLDPLVDVALEGSRGEAALDLYAGVGLFSLPLAQRFGRVTAVESGGGAVRDLQFNAERADIAIDVRQMNVDSFLASLEMVPEFVLADPPRSGLGRAVIGYLARLKPARITIVACNPATLARDLAGLLAAGYQLDQVALIDLFPQTFHIETVAKLKL